jgi:esterase/lipase
MEYQQAIDFIAAIQAKEGLDILPASHTRLMTHGQKTAGVVIFFHGYTSGPQQFVPLGERCFDLGYNVYIPRLSHHGYANIVSDATQYVNAKELAAEADQAIDLAQGLGDQLIVAGLSMGGVLTAWVAQRRPEVAQAIIISPAFGAYTFPTRWLWLIAHGLLLLPDTIRWWDEVEKEKAEGPYYNYRRFSTHGLMQIFRLGFRIRSMARHTPPAAQSVWMILNDNDFSVDNVINQQLVADWKHSGATCVESYTFPKELKLPHDDVSIENPGQHTDIVHPILLKLIQGKRL